MFYKSELNIYADESTIISTNKLILKVSKRRR